MTGGEFQSVPISEKVLAAAVAEVAKPTETAIFSEAIRLLPHLVKVQDLMEQANGFVIARDPAEQNFRGAASMISYDGDSAQIKTATGEIFIDNLLGNYNPTGRPHFSLFLGYKEWLCGIHNRKDLPDPSDRNRDIVMAKIAKKNTVVMALTVGEHGLNRWNQAILIFTLDNEQSVNQLETFLKTHGAKGLSTYFQLLISNTLLPEFEIEPGSFSVPSRQGLFRVAIPDTSTTILSAEVEDPYREYPRPQEMVSIFGD